MKEKNKQKDKREGFIAVGIIVGLMFVTFLFFLLVGITMLGLWFVLFGMLHYDVTLGLTIIDLFYGSIGVSILGLLFVLPLSWGRLQKLRARI